MQTLQMKLQKILTAGYLALSGLVILYALGFSTDLYALSYHIDASSSLMYVPGAELYTEVQPFNRTLFIYALYSFLLCLTLFLSLSHRRRLYRLSNYLTSMANAAFSVFLGWELLSHTAAYRKAYLDNVDFERMQEVTEMLRMRYVESTLLLDAGYVVSVLLFVAAGLLLLNLVLKSCWMRRECWAEEGDTV